MSRIRGSDTGPEIILRKKLWAAGLRYRLKSRVIGRPDLVFPSAKVAVFVDGCFWHGCPQHYTFPKTNAKFWRGKISRNIARDQEVNSQLKSEGWKVLRFWEHELSNNADRCADRILAVVSRRNKR